MADIKLTEETLRYMSLFERVTSTSPLDCMEHEEKLIFVVNKKRLGLAIGKSGENLKRLRELCKRPVEIIGYSQDPEAFIRSIFHTSRVKEVVLDRKDGKLTAYVKVDVQDKGKTIGKGGKNLRFAKELAQRHSEVENIVIS